MKKKEKLNWQSVVTKRKWEVDIFSWYDIVNSKHLKSFLSVHTLKALIKPCVYLRQHIIQEISLKNMECIKHIRRWRASSSVMRNWFIISFSFPVSPRRPTWISSCAKAKSKDKIDRGKLIILAFQKRVKGNKRERDLTRNPGKPLPKAFHCPLVG